MTHIKIAAAVEAAADGFVDVILLNAVAGFKVGDGAGDFQDAVVGSRAHVHLGDGLAEFFHSFGVGFGVFVEQSGCHLGAAMHAWVILEAQALDGARFDDSFANCCARFAWRFARHLVKVHWLNLDLQVNTLGDFRD